MPRSTWDNLDADRRERVLRAAMEEFGQHGYTGGSLNVIARVADVAKGSLFQYFHDKSDLFAHVAEQTSLRIYVAMEAYLDKPAGDVPFLERFTALVETWMAYMAEHPLERGVTAATTMELDPQVRRAVRAPVHRLYAQGIRPLLQQAVEAGELRPGTDVEALLSMLVMLLPHLAIAPFEPGLDVTIPLYGQKRQVRSENARRLLEIVFAGVIA